MAFKINVFLLIFIILGLAEAKAAPQPISDVQITPSGFLYNRLTDTFDATVTIRNSGSIPLASPFRLVIDSVNPSSVSLYNIYGTTQNNHPYIDVPITGYVLNSGESTTVPVRFVNMGKAVTSVKFSVEAEKLDPTHTAEIIVKASMNLENGGNTVGAGYSVKIDGTTRAKTDSKGQAQIVVPISTKSISVSAPPNYIGYSDIAGLASGEVRSVDVELGDSGEFGADSNLRIDRVQHLMLPKTTPQISLRFFQNEKPVLMDLIEAVELRDPAGGNVKDISSLFSIRSDNSLYANTNSFLSAIGSLAGKKVIFAQVLDKQGNPHLQEVPFYISLFNVQGKITAPPSNPSLPLGGIKLSVSVLNTEISFITESNADGTFPLPPLLPAGNVLIQSSTSSNGVNYIGQGTAVISANTSINIRMRGPIDISNNIPPITTSPL